MAGIQSLFKKKKYKKEFKIELQNRIYNYYLDISTEIL